MGKAAAARRLATAAAVGGGGLSVAGASFYALLRAEAVLARKRIGYLDLVPPDASGWYGQGGAGPAIRLVVVGDSSAAGYGVDSVHQTPGAHLASGLAEGARRPVCLRGVARVGAQSTDLHRQVDAALRDEADVTVILIGTNDVTHARRPAESVRLLADAVRRLRGAGVEVVVGTCPDLGTVEPILPPLRQVARAWSRRLAAAQMIGVVEAGGRAVSLGSVLGPEFAATPAVLFGPDRFHPSAAGYSSMASVLLPSVLASVGVIPQQELAPEAFRGDQVLPIGRAAVEAVRVPGTEIDGARAAADRSQHPGARTARSRRGGWVQLRHRRRTSEPEAQTPVESEAETLR